MVMSAQTSSSPRSPSERAPASHARQRASARTSSRPPLHRSTQSCVPSERPDLELAVQLAALVHAHDARTAVLVGADQTIHAAVGPGGEVTRLALFAGAMVHGLPLGSARGFDAGRVHVEVLLLGGARCVLAMRGDFLVVEPRAVGAFVRDAFAAGRVVRGNEVDQVCRDTISSGGYEKFFTHRTGHSIGTEVHGEGANIDSIETLDERALLPSTCFSIEPGIYASPIGVRSEISVCITPRRQVEVFGAIQRELLTM